MPSSGTFSIGTNSRDYSTISGWEADTDVSLTGLVVGEIYNDSVFDETVTIDGATNLSSSNRRRLDVPPSEIHDGTPGTGARIVSSIQSGRFINAANEDYFQVWGLELDNTQTDPSGVFNGINLSNTSGAEGEARRCIVHGMKAGLPVGIDSGNAYNCIVFDVTAEGSSDVVALTAVCFDNGNELINCTGDDATASNSGSGGQIAHIFRNFSEARNCIGTRADDADFPIGGTQETNASSDGTASGITGITISNEVVDVANRDYHLQSGSQLVDAGTDLGDVPAKIDIDGGDRHAAGVVWDIGADEEGLPVPVTTVTVGQAVETDTAQPVTASKLTVVTVGQATEADVGFSTGWSKILSVGLANEVDTGFSVNPVESQAIGLAFEVDTGLSVGFLKVGVVAVGLAQEQNLGLAVGRSKVARVGLATEVDAAFGITPTASLRVGLANEVDAAFGIDWIKLLSAGLAREIDTAFGVTPRQPINVGLATEVDTALVVGPVKVYSVGLATERGIAFSIVGERFAARSTQQIIEVANTRPDLAAQVTQMPVEVWSRQELQAFITQFNIEHLARYVIDGRPTQLILEVLRSVGGVPIGCPQGEDVTFTTESSEDTGFISPGPGVDPDFISLGPEVDPDF